MGEGFPFFDAILFAMLAGFLIFRLRNVLGRRTGNERRPTDAFSPKPEEAGDNDNVIALPDRDHGDSTDTSEENPDGETVTAAVMRIKMADGGFDEGEFLRGAKIAFEMVVTGFANGDMDSLQSLLSRDLYASFAAAIEARETAGETLETRVATVKSADIVEASLIDGTASLTIEFISEQIKVLKDADGEVLEGDPDRLDTVTDIWSFVRNLSANDPNWQLVATRVPEE